MLAVKNLERLIEIEEDLKSQYEAKLNAKSAELDKAAQDQKAQQETITQLQATIAEQQQNINQLSAPLADNKRIEQLNRELNSRVTKLQDELSAQKKRNKTLQRELATEREELKEFKQFDPKKMKKNLDNNKKKLAEQTAANDLLQKNYKKFKTENQELKQKVEELEAKLADTTDSAETESNEEKTGTE